MTAPDLGDERVRDDGARGRSTGALAGGAVPWWRRWGARRRRVGGAGRDVAIFLVAGAALSAGKRLVAPEEAARPVLEVEADQTVEEAILVDLAVRSGALGDGVVRDRLARNLDFVGEGDVDAAIAMDMHRKDAIARARLAEIGRALVIARLPEETPSDAELEAYLRSHVTRYATPAAARFEHEQVKGGVIPVSLAGMQSATRIDATFGGGFAEAVMRAPLGEWTEITSSYGVHRVRVVERREARLPPLDEVRLRVMRDFQHDRRPRRLAEALARLREGYDLREEPGGDRRSHRE